MNQETAGIEHRAKKNDFEMFCLLYSVVCPLISDL